MTRETLVLQGNGKIVTLTKYRENHLQRLIEEAKPEQPQVISTDEHQEILRRSSFKCPKKHHIELCNGTGCPTRKDNPHDDYFDECVNSRGARLLLNKIAEGRIIIDKDINEGFEVKFP